MEQKPTELEAWNGAVTRLGQEVAVRLRCTTSFTGVCFHRSCAPAASFNLAELDYLLSGWKADQLARGLNGSDGP